MKNNNLAEGSVLKTLIYFALPFIVANILQSLYGAVDLFVVGKYCDAKSIAAVSTGTQITQIETSLITGLTMGSTVLIGEYTGAKREEMIKKAIGTSLSAFFVAALVLTALMLVFNRPLLSVMKTPPEAFELTVQYVAVCSAGNIFICGYNAISAILRGWGDSVRPMVFVAAACVINIILDFIFVKYLNMGVAGTALATVISQAISAIWVLHFLTGKKATLRIKRENLGLDIHILMSICALGISPFIMGATESLISVVFNSGAQKYGGDLYVGSITILQSVMQMISVPMNGFASGASEEIVIYTYWNYFYELLCVDTHLYDYSWKNCRIIYNRC